MLSQAHPARASMPELPPRGTKGRLSPPKRRLRAAVFRTGIVPADSHAHPPATEPPVAAADRSGILPPNPAGLLPAQKSPLLYTRTGLHRPPPHATPTPEGIRCSDL
jgi:hypothetical protein